MAYDADLPSQVQDEAHFWQHRCAARTCTANQQMIPKIDMVIGSWYLDELGIKTREITARE
jgi:hypothetical protein